MKRCRAAHLIFALLEASCTQISNDFGAGNYSSQDEAWWALALYSHIIFFKLGFSNFSSKCV